MKNLISLFILMVFFQCQPANNREPLLDLAKAQAELSAEGILNASYEQIQTK